jgi:hypothetical protein
MTGSTPQRRIVAEVPPQSSRSGFLDSTAGWSVIGLAGLLFFVVGTVDLAILWYPLNFGNVLWEFGTVVPTLNGLPGTTIGLSLMAAAALGRGLSGRAKTLAAVLLVEAVIVLTLGLLFATTAPVALRGVPAGSLEQFGLKRAVVKAAAQIVVYPILLTWMAMFIWRRAGKAAPAST